MFVPPGSTGLSVRGRGRGGGGELFRKPQCSGRWQQWHQRHRSGQPQLLSKHPQPSAGQRERLWLICSAKRCPIRACCSRCGVGWHTSPTGAPLSGPSHHRSANTKQLLCGFYSEPPSSFSRPSSASRWSVSCCSRPQQSTTAFLSLSSWSTTSSISTWSGLSSFSSISGATCS